MKFSVSVPDHQVAGLDVLADELGVKRADLVRLAVGQLLAGFHRGCYQSTHRSTLFVPAPTVEPLFPDLTPAGVLPEHPRWHPSAPPIPPPKKRERDQDLSFEPQRGTPEPTLVERGIDPTALTAELVGVLNARGVKLRPDDPRAQRAVVARLTGAGLAQDDCGPATVEQVRQVVAHCAATWSPRMLGLPAILGKPKFWEHHGRVGAPAGAPGQGSVGEQRRERYQRRREGFTTHTQQELTPNDPDESEQRDPGVADAPPI